jgi:hypothetical protein
MDRLSIESLNIQGSYFLKDSDLTDYKCTLCRNSLMLPSIENMKKNKLNINISVGNCNHLFHSECIKLHQKNSLSCPIDRTPWETKDKYSLSMTK